MKSPYLSVVNLSQALMLDFRRVHKQGYMMVQKMQGGGW